MVWFWLTPIPTSFMLSFLSDTGCRVATHCKPTHWPFVGGSDSIGFILLPLVMHCPGWLYLDCSVFYTGLSGSSWDAPGWIESLENQSCGSWNPGGEGEGPYHLSPRFSERKFLGWSKGFVLAWWSSTLSTKTHTTKKQGLHWRTFGGKVWYTS